MIRIGRCLPPAVAPLTAKDIFSGLAGAWRGEPEINRLRCELNDFFGVSHSFLVSSGKAALTAVLQALKEISPGRDEVLIPAFTCYSVPSAIVRAGLKIRLCDLAPGTFDFDYERLSEIVSAHVDHILCVVPVHLFGFPADLDHLRKIIRDKPVFIVEDAAQAMGGESNGKKLGTLGDVGLFSLGRGKALSTVEGGVIITKREDIAMYLEKSVHAMRDYTVSELVALLVYSFALFVLSRPSLFWLPKSLPFVGIGETVYDPRFKMRKMTAFQAGLAREWEGKLLYYKKVRAVNVRFLLKSLDSIGLKPEWANRGPLPDLIRFPWKAESVRQRKSILHKSETTGLGIARTYPDSVDRIRELDSLFVFHDFPVAKENVEKLLTLPVHPFVTVKDTDKCAAILARAR